MPICLIFSGEDGKIGRGKKKGKIKRREIKWGIG
jgi:hypothetical protein